MTVASQEQRPSQRPSGWEYQADQPPRDEDLIGNIADTRARIQHFNGIYMDHQAEMTGQTRDRLIQAERELRDGLRHAFEEIYRWSIYHVGGDAETLMHYHDGQLVREITVETGAIRILKPGDTEILVTTTPIIPNNWTRSMFRIGTHMAGKGGRIGVDSEIFLPPLLETSLIPSAASLEQVGQRSNGRAALLEGKGAFDGAENTMACIGEVLGGMVDFIRNRGAYEQGNLDQPQPEDNLGGLGEFYKPSPPLVVVSA